MTPSALMTLISNFKSKRLRDKKYLAHVRQLGCLVCRTPWCGDAHHITYAEPNALSLKVGDNWVVPLCRNCHFDLHMKGDERKFWDIVDRDPIEWATREWKEWKNGDT